MLSKENLENTEYEEGNDSLTREHNILTQLHLIFS